VRISYGKLRVPLHRVTERPDGAHDLFACEADVEVLGDNFTAAYTEGDNREVVATDTMKNYILRQGLSYAGDTLEGFADHLARGLLDTYPVMEAVRVTVRELRFDRLSPVLFERSTDDRAVAMVQRDADGPTDHRSGREGLWLLKVTGSAFTRFARDEYTTLPERVDRPLYVRMDVHWRYADPADGADPRRHVPPQEVHDLIAETFDAFVSESIQHLVHEIGTRVLARWEQLAQVTFTAENHTRDPVDEHGGTKVFTDPFPAQGLITLTLDRGA
jgi:urate oxidase/2-oxo-4-hydroxy-4-carboxy-5-ureidoimidazoline decarboxylase